MIVIKDENGCEQGICVPATPSCSEPSLNRSSRTASKDSNLDGSISEEANKISKVFGEEPENRPGTSFQHNRVSSDIAMIREVSNVTEVSQVTEVSAEANKRVTNLSVKSAGNLDSPTSPVSPGPPASPLGHFSSSGSSKNSSSGMSDKEVKGSLTILRKKPYSKWTQYGRITF